ncbi:MAG TPA: MipA/OmpV family protein [Rhizomicrobium sp.]|nr:MipA/OmpV family protein [Rhizomicrobium sp.]
MRTLLTALAVFTLAAAAPACAQDNPTGGDGGIPKEGIQGYVALGAGLLPDYEGASKYVTVPYFDGQANLGNYFLRFDGALELNLLDDEHFHAGPLIGYRMGRGDVYSGAVARMAHIRYSMTEGGFVEWEHMAEDPRSGERITLTAAEGNINRDTGLEVDLRALAHRPLAFIDEGLIATLEIDTAWSDGDYMQTFFGVNAADAAASRFPVFNAGAGVKSAGISLSLDQFLSPKFSIGIRAHYARLLNAAADSPVTRIAGSADQMFGGVVVGYVL